MAKQKRQSQQSKARPGKQNVKKKPRKKAAKKLRPFQIALLAALIPITLFVMLVIAGPLRFNAPLPGQYPVWGVDVSEYQGVIDWQAFARQEVGFAFIKATEGSSYTDPAFAANWHNAAQAGIPTGAYHFFSFESAGQTQAENFLGVLSAEGMGALPPVLDIELYGDYRWNLPDAKTVREELYAMIVAVEQFCGRKPILYTTNHAYRLYLEGVPAYNGCPIWIRDVYFWPNLPDGREWTFWQYSDKGRLEGYQGQEAYIDLNVFHGTQEQWEKFLALPAE